MTVTLVLLIGLVVGGVLGLAAGLALAHKAPDAVDEMELPLWHTETVGSAFSAPAVIPAMPTRTYAVASDCFLIVSDGGQVLFPLPNHDASDVKAMKQVWASVEANPNGQQWTLYHGHRVRGRVGVAS